jgi:hypothetical protein
MDLTMMERVGDRWEKMEGYCSTGQSPPWAVVSVEEEEELGHLLNGYIRRAKGLKITRWQSLRQILLSN